MKIFLSCIFYSSLSLPPAFAQSGSIIDDFPVSTASGQAVYNPSIAIAPGGGFGISWGDERNGENGNGGIGRIYSALFNQNGTPIGNNFWTDDVAYAEFFDKFSLYASSALFLPAGPYVVAWHVNARSSSLTGGIPSDGVYYSAFTSPGVRTINEVEMNWVGNSESGYATSPSITMFPPSNFMVVYEYSLNSVSKIGGTLVDATTGNRAGDAFVVSDNNTNGRKFPSAASNGTHTIIAWTDGRDDTQGDIYFQRIAGKNFSGSNVKVNSNAGPSYNQYCRVAMNSSGKFVIAWIDTRSNAGGDLYAQSYDASAAAVGSNFKMTSSNSSFYAYPTGLALSDNDVITAAWTDSVAGKRFTAKTRSFAFNGTPLTPVTEISNSSQTAESGFPDVKCSSAGVLYYTWLDGRQGGNGRIYAKVVNKVTDVHKSESLLPDDFSLRQNYPNPFNPSTTITYTLPAPGHVTLTITDLLGRSVVVLLDADEDAGVHSLRWNAEAVSGGVYFYRIEAGNFSQTRKMILAK